MISPLNLPLTSPLFIKIIGGFSEQSTSDPPPEIADNILTDRYGNPITDKLNDEIEDKST